MVFNLNGGKAYIPLPERWKRCKKSGTQERARFLTITQNDLDAAPDLFKFYIPGDKLVRYSDGVYIGFPERLFESEFIVVAE